MVSIFHYGFCQNVPGIQIIIQFNGKVSSGAYYLPTTSGDMTAEILPKKFT